MFLITRPNHDNTTNYLFHWSKEIIKVAEDKGKKVIDLNKKKANRKKLETFLKKKNINFIMLNGHGDDDCVYGYKDELLIKSSENARLLDNKIIYCRSCNSGKKLGPDSIISGAKAFIGYKDVFIFIYDPNNAVRPLQDKYAKRFLEPDNTCVISILKGNPIIDAYNNSQSQYKKQIRDLMTSETDPEEAHVIPALFWNMNNHIWEGDCKTTY